MKPSSKQFATQGIILTRTDFGEADRILTFITPTNGKVKAMAKGVRKPKAKLAGGLELFSVSDITIVKSRGEIDTLISARLIRHYGNIVKDLKRTETGYEMLRILNKGTEEAAEEGYYHLLEVALAGLDESELDPSLAMLWFQMQLLKLSGHSPNLQTDIAGARLKEASTYNFYPDKMRFSPKPSKQGSFTSYHIKFLRLGFAADRPQILKRVENFNPLIDDTKPLVETMLKSYVRI